MKKLIGTLMVGFATISATLFATAGTAYANGFYVKQLGIYPDDKLWRYCNEPCPEIDYQFVSTGQAWLDTIINKEVLAVMESAIGTNNKTQKQVEAFYKKPIISQKELEVQVERVTKAIIIANNDEPSSASYQFVAKPELLGWHKGLVLMGMASYVYTGGAHGLSMYRYYVFDLKDKKQLRLDDILIGGKKHTLKTKLHAKYHDYLRQNDIDPATWAWEFALTDNFSFDKDGMTFLYQPYEITPYVMGMPTLQLSYQELSGVVQAKYLN